MRAAPRRSSPAAGATDLTQQKQLDVLGGDHPVLLQVFLDGLAPVQSRALLGAQCTSHVSRRISNPVVSPVRPVPRRLSISALSLGRALLPCAVCYSIRPGLRARRSRDSQTFFFSVTLWLSSSVSSLRWDWGVGSLCSSLQGWGCC